LIGMLGIGVDDDDADGVGIQHAAQPVGGKRSSGAVAEDDDCLAHAPRISPGTRGL